MREKDSIERSCSHPLCLFLDFCSGLFFLCFLMFLWFEPSHRNPFLQYEGSPYFFLSIVCNGTHFHFVACMGPARGAPASNVRLQHFTQPGSSWAGLPTSISVDRGKEWMGEFEATLKEFEVNIKNVPLESAWQRGLGERHGGIWKEIWRRVVQDTQVHGLGQVALVTPIINQFKNEFDRVGNFSPA